MIGYIITTGCIMWRLFLESLDLFFQYQNDIEKFKRAIYPSVASLKTARAIDEFLESIMESREY